MESVNLRARVPERNDILLHAMAQCFTSEVESNSTDRYILFITITKNIAVIISQFASRSNRICFFTSSGPAKPVAS
jgi:hypothetical protein